MARLARLQPQAGPALTPEPAGVDVEALVDRHRDGELSLADIARHVADAGLTADVLPASGLNACELGVVEATLGRLSPRERR